MKILLLYTFCFIHSFNWAQSSLKISFTPYNGNLPLTFNSVVSNLTGEKVKISTFYYYISNIHILHDGGQDLDLSDTVIIIRNDQNIFDFGIQDITDVEQINFGVGVPQSLNHSDISTYPEIHPLSFQSPSMQWGWSSGYNQVGIIGSVDSNDDDTPETAFEFFPISDNLYRSIELPISSTTINDEKFISIQTNIDQWYRDINLSTNGILHGSTGNNVILMHNSQYYSVFTAEASAEINSIKIEEGKINYNLYGDLITINWSEFQNAEKYKLISVNGSIIDENSNIENNGTIQLSNITTGNYLFIIYSKDGNQLKNLRIIK